MQGAEQTLRQSILDFLGDVGDVPEAVQEALQEERNLERLRFFNRAAARASTIEEFTRMMEAGL